MASIPTHAIAGAALSPLFLSRLDPAKWIAAGAVLAMVPDLDVAAFGMGIPYSSPLGHRGITHSLFFAILLGYGCAQWIVRYPAPWRLSLYLMAATASHGLIDMCTNGGRGVGIFLPFTARRFFFPARPIQVSEIGVDFFFSPESWIVIRTEMIWVWLPSAVIFAIARSIRR
jgi:inner membrane protein